jgi:hypothetical protein
MDPNRTLEAILSALLGGGGIAGLLAAWKAYKSKQGGVSKDEGEVIRTQAIEIGTPPDLIKYWKTEISAVRLEYARYRARSERLNRWYEARIDQLEAWIWEGRPPPPPHAPPRDEIEGNDVK